MLNYTINEKKESIKTARTGKTAVNVSDYRTRHPLVNVADAHG